MPLRPGSATLYRDVRKGTQHSYAMQPIADATSGSTVSMHAAGSNRGIHPTSVPPSPTSHQDQGMWCLAEALHKIFEQQGTHSRKDLQAFSVALQLQLEGRWKYAANTYRNDHPDELPDEKFYRNRRHTRLLPRVIAEERLAVWIPWAIQRLREGFEALAAQFAALTLVQVQAVENELEEEVFEDEII